MRIWNARSSETSFARRAVPPHHAPIARAREALSPHADHILKEHAMWINTPGARLALTQRRALRLGQAEGSRLRAVSGSVWITIDDDPRDIVLDPGEEFLVDSARGLVVLPLGERATLDVCADATTAAQASARVTAGARKRAASTPWRQRVEGWLYDWLAPRPA
jgi:hypothetical protein